MQKTPILLLHGALGTSQSFKQLLPLLEDKFEVYSFDFIGHGKNVTNNKPLNMDNLTQQISDFLEANHLEKIHIFGYSMGGYAAMNLAQQQPEKVKTLFTFATKWDWNMDSSKKEASMLDAEKIQEKVPKFASYLAALHGENTWKTTAQKVQQMMLELGENNPFDASSFQSITTPVLLSVGDRDMTVSIEETVGVYRQLANSSLFIIPKTPHAFEKVNVHLIANMINQFCKDE